jgi:hypothetical protein
VRHDAEAEPHAVARSPAGTLLQDAARAGEHADASSKAVFDALLRAAEQGALSKAALTASYGRIMQLKSSFHD